MGAVLVFPPLPVCELLVTLRLELGGPAGRDPSRQVRGGHDGVSLEINPWDASSSWTCFPSSSSCLNDGLHIAHSRLTPRSH